eukprot:TRINITY_DN15542_c0_g3_i1.p1 TRINITY_DN15542_c0_g3~~TRINITY_DN15542_c0_g3_i1.p1  ORF type:complete len:259 (+),score=52.84 TRINITY_DN15542_c0_g3_i1:40-816(+)
MLRSIEPSILDQREALHSKEPKSRKNRNSPERQRKNEVKRQPEVRSPFELRRDSSQKSLRQRKSKEGAVVRRIAVVLNAEETSQQPAVLSSIQRFKRSLFLSKQDLKVKKAMSPFIKSNGDPNLNGNTISKQRIKKTRWRVKTVQLEIKMDLENQMRRLQHKKAEEESHKRQKSLNMKKFILKQLEPSLTPMKEGFRRKIEALSTETNSISFNESLANPRRFTQRDRKILSSYEQNNNLNGIKAVSYTHLTLPTTPYV